MWDYHDCFTFLEDIVYWDKKYYDYLIDDLRQILIFNNKIKEKINIYKKLVLIKNFINTNLYSYLNFISNSL